MISSPPYSIITFHMYETASLSTCFVCRADAYALRIILCIGPSHHGALEGIFDALLLCRKPGKGNLVLPNIVPNTSSVGVPSSSSQLWFLFARLQVSVLKTLTQRQK